MTAHVVYPVLDAAVPATWSQAIIEQVIRDRFGFHGFLLSDDICMGALSGPMVTRAERALTAGCDLAVHCDGDAAALAALWNAIEPLSSTDADRWARSVRGQAVVGRLTAPTAEDWRAWQAGEAVDG
jgi:beta-N-acetylhexosaminidase